MERRKRRKRRKTPPRTQSCLVRRLKGEERVSRESSPWTRRKRREVRSAKEGGVGGRESFEDRCGSLDERSNSIGSLISRF